MPDAVADVRRLLADDGLADVPVLPTSAVTGDGLDRLRDVLTGAVAAHRAALRRVVRRSGHRGCGPGRRGGRAGPRRDRRAGAARARRRAGGGRRRSPRSAPPCSGPTVHRAVAATGFPFTRWLRRLRPDPLRRLHLDRGRVAAVTAAGADDADLMSRLQRTSLPAAGAVERSRVELAAAPPRPTTPRPGCPTRGRTPCATPPGPAAADLADALDRAVADHRPRGGAPSRCGGGRSAGCRRCSRRPRWPGRCGWPGSTR